MSARTAALDRNVEIKARVSDLGGLVRRASALAARGPVVVEQTDTFFHCSRGRLKLREIHGAEAELIYYERADRHGPTESRFLRSRCGEPEALREALGRALGVRGSVRKRRTLFLVGRTRIHVDEVEGLGAFVELEVELQGSETEVEGAATARDLMHRLGIAPEDLVELAYIDLLEEQAAAGSAS